MAVKTFGSERLTSSDINTYLTNSGLVYVKSQTIGTAVSSVTVTGAFSADYENYRIILTGGIASTQIDIGMQLGTTNSGYAYGLVYNNLGTATPLAATSNSAVSWPFVGAGTSNILDLCADIRSPFLSKYTIINSTYIQTVAGGGVGPFCGYLGNTTSYSDFKIFPNSGTITGGTITVYGYRKA